MFNSNNNIPREINSNISNNFTKQTYSNHVPLHLYRSDEQVVTNNNLTTEQKIEGIENLSPIPNQLKKGDRLGPNQRFLVIKIIANPKNGFGVVVKCADTLRIYCDIAIKIVEKHAQAQREIDCLARCQNKLLPSNGIITFLEWFDYQYINANNEYVKLKALVLEFCPCGDMMDYIFNFFNKYQLLSQRLAKLENELQTSFDENKSLKKKKLGDELNYIRKLHILYVQKWFSCIAEGVSKIHSFGIAHRDLSLENLLLDNNYNVKIADFGLAFDINSIQQLQTPPQNRYQYDFVSSADTSPNQSVRPSRISQQLIQLPGRFGKNYYMSPQMHSSQCNPFMNDIWSLGVILFMMLCGRPAYEKADKNNFYFKRFMYQRDNSRFNPNVFFKEYPHTSFLCSYIDSLGRDNFFTPQAKDLLNRIFQEKEQNRISIGEILKHSYVIGEQQLLTYKATNYAQTISSPLPYYDFNTSNDNLYSPQLFFPLNANNMAFTCDISHNENMGMHNTFVPVETLHEQSLELPLVRNNQYDNDRHMNEQTLPYINPSFRSNNCHFLMENPYKYNYYNQY